MDTSTVIKFIQQMHWLDNTTSSFLYIATNEGNSTDLEALETAGIYTWWTLYKKYQFKMRSIEMFLVELQLMIDANRFLRARASFGWMSYASWIDQLVEIERERKGKRGSEVIDYP